MRAVASALVQDGTDRRDERLIEEHELREFTSQCGAFDPHTQVQIERYGSSERTDSAIILPVHNQASIIHRVLSEIAAHSNLDHEFVIVVDGCSDGTLDAVHNWVAEQTYTRRTQRVIVANIPAGVFETMSDAVGIALSTSDWIIEVQADVFMEEDGFDAALIGALKQYPDLFCVSGRGAHRAGGPRRGPLSIIRRLGSLVARALHHAWPDYRPSRPEYYLTDQIGRCGDLIDKPLRPEARRRLYLHDTVMRGPIAFKAERYRELNGFDTDHFFLGDDDHDLFARAFKYLNLRVAYLPIRFTSPLTLGSTRRARPEAEQRRFEELRSYYRSAASQSFLHSGLATADLPRIERPLSAHS